MTNTAQPYRVPNKIHAAILQLDAIPQFGNAPAFPWKQLTGNLAKHLELEGLKLTPSNSRWLEPAQLTSDLGSPLTTYAFHCTSIEGCVYALMTEDAVNQLLAWILTKQTHALGIPDSEIVAGLKKFLAIEACHCFDKLQYVEGVMPALAANNHLPSEGVLLACDLALSFKEQTLNVRFAFTSDFITSWRAKVDQHKPRDISPELASQVALDAHLAAGRVTLSPEQFEGLKPGDFLIPDSCFLEKDPTSGKVRGHAWMSVNGITVAHTRIGSGGKVEIIETAQG